MDTRDERDRIESDEDEPVRQGDVLGLGGSAVPKSPADPSADFDEEARARRHARALEDERGAGALAACGDSPLASAQGRP
jgi:hypothetical protein